MHAHTHLEFGPYIDMRYGPNRYDPPVGLTSHLIKQMVAWVR